MYGDREEKRCGRPLNRASTEKEREWVDRQAEKKTEKRNPGRLLILLVVEKKNPTRAQTVNVNVTSKPTGRCVCVCVHGNRKFVCQRDPWGENGKDSACAAGVNGEWYFGIVCMYCAHMQNNSYGTSQLPDDRFTKEVHSIQCVGVCVCVKVGAWGKSRLLPQINEEAAKVTASVCLIMLSPVPFSFF